jgi:uncharacterized membrane protein YdcZ (DUF606 family)
VNIERLNTPWWALRTGLGAAAFLTGLDKFFNLLAAWPAYLSPLAAMAIAAFTLARLTEAGADARDQVGARSLLGRRENVTA